MAAAQSMCAAQSHDLAVIKTHTAEDGAKVRLLLRAVGETTIRRAHTNVSVGPAGAPWHDGTLHLLDGADAGECPEVGVGDPGEFLWKHMLERLSLGAFKARTNVTFDRLEEVTGCLETGVCAMVSLWGESHGGAIGSAGVGKFVIASKFQHL